MTLAEGLVDDFSISVFFKFTAVGVAVVSPCFPQVTGPFWWVNVRTPRLSFQPCRRTLEQRT